jgi:hypothetical protein
MDTREIDQELNDIKKGREGISEAIRKLDLTRSALK